jgi:hypothetical protein
MSKQKSGARVEPAPAIHLAVPEVPPADDEPQAAPAEHPPASELLLVVQRTIGHAGVTWERGEVVPAAVFEAIPGCDVERLLAKGALTFQDEA